MQFCSYSKWFAPNNAIERTLPLLLPVLIGILMFMLLSDEKHIKKITKNLSIFAKSVITFLYVCIVILLPTTLIYIRMPKYGILSIEYLDPDTPTTISQSEIVDELCPLIENDFFGYYFNYNYPWDGTNKRHKNLILTKDEWLKIKASEDKIEKAAKDAREQEKRGNLEIIK